MRIKNLFKLIIILLSINLLISTVSADNHCLKAKQQLAKVDEWGKVSKIIDGDTVHLQDGRKIRFVGINTPEVGRRGTASQAFAYQAHQALNKLLADHKKIGLSYDEEKKDHYKRMLAYVVLKDGRSVEQILLEKGLAVSIAVPPNMRHINCYRAIEKKARDIKLGLWKLPEYQIFKAHNLSKKAKGYRLLSGKVSKYSKSKKSIYLELTSKLSIRIAKKDLHYFSGLKPKSLVGKKVQVRGWVNSYKGKQSIHVRSAYDLQY